MARVKKTSKNSEKIPDSYEGRRAVDVLAPDELASPLIFASPHSGRDYPVDLLRNARLDRHGLRQSEDCYVDLLFDEAPQMGAPLLRALFPRAYVDVNRSRDELDPRMFADNLPSSADTRSSRVIAGLGVIPRIVADGHDIYDRKLYFRDARRRLNHCYDPYHETLIHLIKAAQDKFGVAIVVDCHSMPSASSTPFHEQSQALDIVLGDRFGSSCAPAFVQHAESILIDLGYETARNAPYAGGFVAASYGRPKSGVHVLQLEINRGLYLDETRIARTEKFEKLRKDMASFIHRISAFDAADLWPAIAAE
ncbi:MAG: N-formylglutamate amidohydrolase [Marinicaulis sp.]|nr:N-formylglutamate amidohydrolase [Marinicaulis sp.]